jgi:hypothetical protein
MALDTDPVQTNQDHPVKWANVVKDPAHRQLAAIGSADTRCDRITRACAPMLRSTI